MASSKPQTDDEQLAFAGVARQADLVRAGEVSSRELTELSLRRIERLDPRLRSFRVVLAERALAEADQADARRGDDDGGRPLLGVPMAVKDVFDVAGETTPNGTSATGTAPAGADSEVVRRLRAAGAVIVGKTHVPELCIWPFTETMTFGATRNPWSLEHSPGGSSGGSGAAVAAGLVAAALGSDGAGSIRIPASCCGIFGLKPQRGRVPLAPHADHWHGLSTAGALTRSVADAALIYDALRDGGGEPWIAAAASPPPRRLRIALSHKIPASWPWAKLGEDQRRATEQTAGRLRELGHEVVEADPDYGQVTNEVTVRYLRGIADDAAATEHPDRLERRTRSLARLGGLIPDSLLARVRAGEAASAERIGRLFADHDVLLTPGLARPPLRIGAFNGRGAIPTLLGAIALTPYTSIWNLTGQPAAAVPAGHDASGLPLSAQLVGRADGEPTLLALAAQLEAQRPWAERRPPVS